MKVKVPYQTVRTGYSKKLMKVKVPYQTARTGYSKEIMKERYIKSRRIMKTFCLSLNKINYSMGFMDRYRTFTSPEKVFNLIVSK